MNKVLEWIKELRLFITLFVAITGVSIFDVDTVLSYVYMYNAHLALLTGLGIYTNHFLSNKRHIHAEARLDTYQKQLTQVILDGNISQLKAEVKQAYKDYSQIEVIDFVTTIKYLKGLDERRIALGVNSYTEDMMNILLSKIKL